MFTKAVRVQEKLNKLAHRSEWVREALSHAKVERLDTLILSWSTCRFYGRGAI